MNGMETARRLIAEEQEKQAGFLDLGNLQITEVPVEVFALTHLRVLNLGSGYRDECGEYRQSANGDYETRNTLNRLPDRLCALEDLTALYLASTQVSDLSPLQSLSALRTRAPHGGAPAPDTLPGGISYPVRAGGRGDLAAEPPDILAQSRRRLLQADSLPRPYLLDQSWALEAVYGVFDRHKAYPLILSQGRFTQSLLAMTAWRAYSEPEQRLFLSLMESCGIAFVDRKADPRLGLETSYVAPDMLPDKEAVAPQLAGRWDDHEESWRLEYAYPFLHPGLMRALLCDVGQRSHEAGVYWKYGVWVYEKSTGCRAMLEQQMADEHRGRITLRVQGRRREDLAHWLQERIQERNRLFGYPDLPPVVDDFSLELRRQERGDASFARIAGHRRGGPTPLAVQDHSGIVEAASPRQNPSLTSCQKHYSRRASRRSSCPMPGVMTRLQAGSARRWWTTSV